MEECRRMPLFVLHELAHAYHEQVFGFDEPGIKAAYQKALQSGKYDAVENYSGKVRRAYAMTDQMEYFAETTEAFFGRNDFYPFDRDELIKHDPQMYRLLKQYWGSPD
jgi:Mlc titration factor MtfA (ptsG expression regulator)